MDQRERADEKPDEAVEEVRSHAEEMQEGLDTLGDHIEDVKSEWRSTQHDDGAAQPPPDDEVQHPPGDDADGGQSGQQQDHVSEEDQSEERVE